MPWPPHGVQRARRLAARAAPRADPWRPIASTANSEHVGRYLQPVGRPARVAWYPRIAPTRILAIRDRGRGDVESSQL